MQKITIVLAIAAGVVLLLGFGCSSIERKLLFHPSHRPDDGGLTPWVKDGEVIGFSRTVEAARNVWLMLHGNGGQAADRMYAMPSFSDEDSVYVLEYPGYGQRKGVPSMESFNRAAAEAYLYLRNAYSNVPVCVVGESIGSGPASHLATLQSPPDKVVLLVPYEKLSEVGKDHFPAILVWLVLTDNWDNVTALSQYKGPVEIFGAREDNVIRVAHAKALAAGVASSRLILIEGGHNDWSAPGRVKIRNP